MSNIDQSQISETLEQEKDGSASWLKKRTKLEKILCFVAVTSLLMVAVMASIIGYVNNSSKVINSSSSSADSSSPLKQCVSDICLSPSCVEAAGILRWSLDENINPCYDFYKFVCGGWIKKKTITDGESFASVYEDANDNLILQLKELMETKLSGTEPSFIVMTKALYDTCMDLQSIEEAGSKPLQNILKHLGGWPVVEGRNWDERKFDWVETLISLRKSGYRNNGLLSVSVSYDRKNETKNIIDLSRPSFGIRNRTTLIQGLDDFTTAAYYRSMVKAAILLGADEVTAKKELLEALNFETNIVKCLPTEEKRNISDVDSKYTIKELQEEIPQVPWFKLISGLVTDVTDEDETLVVYLPEFVQKVADLIKKTKKRVIANYILWHVVLASLSRLSKDWREINLELKREIEETSRLKECFFRLRANLPIALSSYYVRHFFKDETKKEVLNLVKSVQKEYLRILDKTDWMDEKTKTNAKAKVNDMIIQIGYTKELLNDTKVMKVYENLNLSKDSYFENILRLFKWNIDNEFSMLKKHNDKKHWTKRRFVVVINAFYDDSENIIEIPAGFLQNPFYNKDHPNYMNFGFIGSTIGHEITHGFDDGARKYDKDENRENWLWENATGEYFRNKGQCILDQYINYTAGIGIKINVTKRQDENFADMGTFHIAYWAYQSWVKDNGPEKLLPGLKYNQNQLFWIMAAYKRCGIEGQEHLKEKILSGRHSPLEYRVNGPISNLEEFVNDFNCPTDSPMNKRHKCRLW